MGIQDLSTIKTNIQSILANANTTTASDYLSQSVSTKVAYIGKVNPSLIMLHSEKYPFVTSYIDGYDITSETHARDQATGIRMATIDLKIIAGVWNPNFSSQSTDQGSEDLERLMQNIENILRNNTSLTNSVDYQKPLDVKFKTFIDEEQDNHVRFGTMTLQIKKRY